jgi:hypothetical protein
MTKETKLHLPLLWRYMCTQLPQRHVIVQVMYFSPVVPDFNTSHCPVYQASSSLYVSAGKENRRGRKEAERVIM